MRIVLYRLVSAYAFDHISDLQRSYKIVVNSRDLKVRLAAISLLALLDPLGLYLIIVAFRLVESVQTNLLVKAIGVLKAPKANIHKSLAGR